MPQATREIKRRIKSIQSTRKITRAMELVAAAKMRKAVAQVLASRPYADWAWQILKRVAKISPTHYHPLLQQRSQVKKIGLILITSNRGLAGSFNLNVINLVADYIRFHREEVEVEADLVLMGKKGREAMIRLGHTIVAEFDKVDITTRVHEVRPLAKLVIDEYLKGVYDKIVIAYTDFVSTLVQKPRIKQILPLTGEDEYLGKVAVAGRQTNKDMPSHPLINEEARLAEVSANYEYLFEPSPQEVLGDLLPRLVEVQIYQAIMESNASEHSARMLAMKNATEAAGEMIYDLTLSYNHARQAAITQEIAEIATAKVALEQ